MKEQAISCPINSTHSVKTVNISFTSYHYCTVCKEDTSFLEQRHLRGKVNTITDKEYGGLDLFKLRIPFISTLIGKSSSGKTELVKTIIQYELANPGYDYVYKVILDFTGEYIDWTKKNNGIVVDSVQMLRATIGQRRFFEQRRIICFSKKALTSYEENEKLIKALFSFCFDSLYKRDRKLLVVDSVDKIKSLHPKFNILCEDIMEKSNEYNLSAFFVSNPIPGTSFFTKATDVILFEQYNSKYPDNVFTSLQIEEDELPEINKLGTYKRNNSIDHVRFVHIGARSIFAINELKHIKK